MNYKTSLKKLIRTNGDSFVFCDVGARWGVEWPWVEFRECIDVIAFEPDKEESDKLDSRYKVFSKCLSESSSSVDLHLLKSRGCSSLLKPNFDFLDSFPNSERFTVEKTETLESVSLDQLYQSKEIADIDFIKIDTQGTELSIVKGGQNLLKNVVGLQVEVEFHQLYQGQPLFADMDLYVRDAFGLELQDLRKTFWKYDVSDMPANSKGKLIFGDALYFRPLGQLDNWCESLPASCRVKKIKNLFFTAFAYGYMDYCFKLLETDVARELLKEILPELRKILLQQNRAFNSKVSWRLRSRIGNYLQKAASFFRPTHENWATTGEGLGNRKKYGCFFN